MRPDRLDDGGQQHAADASDGPAARAAGRAAPWDMQDVPATVPGQPQHPATLPPSHQPTAVQWQPTVAAAAPAAPMDISGGTSLSFTHSASSSLSSSLQAAHCCLLPISSYINGGNCAMCCHRQLTVLMSPLPPCCDRFAAPAPGAAQPQQHAQPQRRAARPGVHRSAVAGRSTRRTVNRSGPGCAAGQGDRCCQRRSTGRQQGRGRDAAGQGITHSSHCCAASSRLAWSICCTASSRLAWFAACTSSGRQRERTRRPW
jgi:hypothetical protein